MNALHPSEARAIIDSRLIYTKTAKGLREVIGKTSGLSRGLRNLLKKIDGRRAVAELQHEFDDYSEEDLQEALQALVDADYIREFHLAPKSVQVPAKKPGNNANAESLDFTARTGPASRAKAARGRPSRAAKMSPAKKESDDLACAEAEIRAKILAKVRAAEEAYRESEQNTARAHREAEEKARRDAEEAMRRESAEQARQAAEAQARRDAEERARRQAEAAVRREADERTRREVEEQLRRTVAEAARKEAEAKTRREAEAKARREAEERARREAEEAARLAAEEEARREAEKQARLATEEAARKEAEARAQREAEARAQHEEEERARREAEEAARLAAEEEARREAEKQARLAAEAAARQEAEARAQREAEERARREAEEAARLAAEEEARREAEKQARRAAEAAARQEAEARAQHEAEERARREAEEATRLAAEEQTRREAEALAQRQADAVARMEEEARAQREAEECARRRAASQPRPVVEHQVEHRAEPMVSARPARRRADWGRRISSAVGVLMVAGIAAIHVLPFEGQRARFEKAATEQLQQPVAIKSLRFAMLPRPHWRIEDVSIGQTGQITLGRVRAMAGLGALLGDGESYSEVEIDGAQIDAEGAQWLLFSNTRSSSLRVDRIEARDVRVGLDNVALPLFAARIDFGADGRWQKANLDATESKIAAELRPQGDAMQIDLSAASYPLPFGASTLIEDFHARGVARPGALEIGELSGHLLGGSVGGTARLKWGSAWSLEGELNARQLDIARLAPELLEDGKLEGKAQYAFRAAEAGKLLAAPRLDGSFSVRKGTLLGIDVANFLQGGNVGGKTAFSEMGGNMTLENGQLQLRPLRLAAGAMTASGAARLDRSQVLQGRLAVDLKSPGRQRNAGVAVTGTLKEPRFGKP